MFLRKSGMRTTGSAAALLAGFRRGRPWPLPYN